MRTYLSLIRINIKRFSNSINVKQMWWKWVVLLMITIVNIVYIKEMNKVIIALKSIIIAIITITITLITLTIITLTIITITIITITLITITIITIRLITISMDKTRISSYLRMMMTNKLNNSNNNSQTSLTITQIIITIIIGK